MDGRWTRICDKLMALHYHSNTVRHKRTGGNLPTGAPVHSPSYPRQLLTYSPLNSALTAAGAAEVENDRKNAAQPGPEAAAPPPGAAPAAGVAAPPPATDCIVCMEPYEDEGDHVPVCLKCGHHFGKSCIERWLSNNRQCPTCKARCDLGQGALAPLAASPDSAGTPPPSRGPGAHAIQLVLFSFSYFLSAHPQLTSGAASTSASNRRTCHLPRPLLEPAC